MIGLYGQVLTGTGHFATRIQNNARVFAQRTGERLYPGTLNVKTIANIPIVEHFRIRGSEIGEPLEDFLFEICKVNGLWAYRVRPLNLLTGEGGHGDDVLEIACSQKIPDASPGDKVKIMFFR